MALQTYKITSIIAVAVVGLIGGLLSLKLAESKNLRRPTSSTTMWQVNRRK